MYKPTGIFRLFRSPALPLRGTVVLTTDYRYQSDRKVGNLLYPHAIGFETGQGAFFSVPGPPRSDSVADVRRDGSESK